MLSDFLWGCWEYIYIIRANRHKQFWKSQKTWQEDMYFQRCCRSLGTVSTLITWVKIKLVCVSTIFSMCIGLIYSHIWWKGRVVGFPVSFLTLNVVIGLLGFRETGAHATSFPASTQQISQRTRHIFHGGRNGGRNGPRNGRLNDFPAQLISQPPLKPLLQGLVAGG